MKYIILSVVFLSSCADDASLNKVCPQKCSPDWIDEGRELLGVCANGIPTCDEDNNLIDCEVPDYSIYEQCDGLDNDCDGEVDEFISMTPQAWKSKFDKEGPCEDYEFGVCRYDRVECLNGEFICKKSRHYESNEVSCDGRDNDCDGLVDEEIRFEQEYCYSGDFYTATNPPCRPGYYSCVYGQKICKGQVLPEEEVCDGVDNNCNGIVDDTEKMLEQSFDIIFNIDISASMCNKIQAVLDALLNYASIFDGSTSFKFAIVVMNNDLGKTVLVSDLTDFSVIRDYLNGIDCYGSSDEPSLDSMYEICSYDNPLGISWRDGADRLVFSFTDEMAQSYYDPNLTTNDVINACLYTLTSNYIWAMLPNDFRPICDNTNGRYFGLSANSEQIFNELNSIIKDICIDE